MTAPSLPEFILARVAEWEAAARATIADSNNSATDGAGEWEFIEYAYEGIYPGAPGAVTLPGTLVAEVPWAEHATIHSPARVLRQCEAIRRIVDEHQIKWPEPCHCGQEHTPKMPGTCKACYKSSRRVGEDFSVPCETLCILAAIWSDHPDFNPAWA